MDTTAAEAASGEAKSSGGSIFEEADFLKDEVASSSEAADSIFTGGKMPYLDANDALDSAFTVIPKELANLAQGNPTYGFFEYIVFLDETFYDAWMTMSEVSGMGLCYGLMATTFLTRLFFTPINVYS